MPHRYGLEAENRAPFEKRSKGYFACKLVDTWPKIYCAPIDYFQEAYLPYYAMKRALSPVVVWLSEGGEHPALVCQ